MNVTQIGIDLAKSSFQIHGIGRNGKGVCRKKLSRAQMLSFFTNLPPCKIGMEACASAHYWARELAKLGHEVKMMAPQFVKPYVKTNKNDATDAEAICEALGRPGMRFVPVKTAQQQAALSIHRVREGFVAERTAVVNRIRGLLGEFGIVFPQGIRYIRTEVRSLIEDGERDMPGAFRLVIQRMLDHLAHLDRQVGELDQAILHEHRENEACRRLAAIPGIGPITATALVATVGDARDFKNGRQLAAWLGLVPRQHSTGGKPTLLGISKRGDGYLRRLLIQGARAVVRFAQTKERVNPWLRNLVGRRHSNVATVALANKNARIVWALLAHGREYQTGYGSAIA